MVTASPRGRTLRRSVARSGRAGYVDPFGSKHEGAAGHEREGQECPEWEANEDVGAGVGMSSSVHPSSIPPDEKKNTSEGMSPAPNKRDREVEPNVWGGVARYVRVSRLMY